MNRIPATMPEQVDYIQGLDINYRTLHDSLDIVDLSTNISITVPFDSLIDKYADFLLDIVGSVELSDPEQEYYKYQPKKVSDELYGTTELWHSILVLNECASIIDFKPKVLYYYDPSKLKAYINEILILEAQANNEDY